MKKQTAANNELLTAIKKIFNGKIYKHALNILNTAGQEDCLYYVNGFVREPYTAVELIESAAQRNREQA